MCVAVEPSLCRCWYNYLCLVSPFAYLFRMHAAAAAAVAHSLLLVLR